jgi:pimeloyl-ACP methyl ester carboxylesterase
VIAVQRHRASRPAEGRPRLVAVPGIDGSDGSIRPIVESLAATRDVSVVNYHDEDARTVEALADQMATALRSGFDEPFDVLGQSIGTIFAAQLAARSGLAVRRVVLCCTFTKLRWNTLRVANAFLSVTPRSIFSATAPISMRVVCGPVGDGGHHPFFEASRNANKAGVIKRTGWQIGRDFSPDIAAVKQPMLILMGARDRFVPNASREVAKLRQLLAHQDAEQQKASRTLVRDAFASACRCRFKGPNSLETT